MKELPPFFDSQASAASQLGISIDDLREAKRAGCPAFRSGRVYHEPLLKWLEQKRSREAPATRPPRGVTPAEDDLLFHREEWEARRDVLFALVDRVQNGFEAGQLDAKEYGMLAMGAVQAACALAEAWKIPREHFNPYGFQLEWVLEVVKAQKAWRALRNQSAKRGSSPP